MAPLPAAPPAAARCGSQAPTAGTLRGRTGIGEQVVVAAAAGDGALGAERGRDHLEHEARVVLEVAAELGGELRVRQVDAGLGDQIEPALEGIEAARRCRRCLRARARRAWPAPRAPGISRRHSFRSARRSRAAAASRACRRPRASRRSAISAAVRVPISSRPACSRCSSTSASAPCRHRPGRARRSARAAGPAPGRRRPRSGG